MNDLRFAFRQLAKSPGFTATVVITLALGISACVTIFALIDSVLLRSYASYSERSVVIRHTRPPDATPLLVLRRAWPAFSQLKSFELLNASFGGFMPLTGEGEPAIISTRWVTQHYFAFHGTKFVIGRGFSSEEYTSEQARTGMSGATGGVAVIAQELWQRAFGARDDIIGRTVQLNGAPYIVVGVATNGFVAANENAERALQYGSLRRIRSSMPSIDGSESLSQTKPARPSVISSATPPIGLSTGTQLAAIDSRTTFGMPSASENISSALLRTRMENTSA